MFGGVELIGGWGLLVGPLVLRLAKEALLIRYDKGHDEPADAEPADAEPARPEDRLDRPGRALEAHAPGRGAGSGRSTSDPWARPVICEGGLAEAGSALLDSLGR